MSDWIAGLISGIAGGGKEMARQAETTLDEISKSRLRAFDLNEDRQTRAADWTNRKMESLEERTSREKENQAQREFQGKENEATRTLTRQQLEQAAAHNQASIGIQQQQLEAQQRQNELTLMGKPVQDADGNYRVLNPTTKQWDIVKDGDKPLRFKGDASETIKAYSTVLGSLTAQLKTADPGTPEYNDLNEQINVYRALITEATMTKGAGNGLAKPTVDSSGKPVAPPAGAETAAAPTKVSEIKQAAQAQVAQETANKEMSTSKADFISRYKGLIERSASADTRTRANILTALYKDAVRLGLTNEANEIKPLLSGVLYKEAATPFTVPTPSTDPYGSELPF